MDQGASGTNQGGGFNDIGLDGVVCVVMCIHCFTTIEFFFLISLFGLEGSKRKI